MMAVKKCIKSILRIFIKIRILLHKKVCLSVSFDEAKEKLNNIYPMETYDLSGAVNKISTYNYDLSIIIPVYNASKYIKECIDSLINQETKYKYEIICIDDGSTDNSLEILKEYNNEKIKIIHQNNGGISSARNTGLNISTGKYVGFVDNDDYVSKDYVEKLLSNAFSNDADYVRCSYIIFDNETNKTIDKVLYKNIVHNDLDNDQDYRSLFKGYMWNGCYKREIWQGFCFPLGYWYEDMIKNMYLYNMCRTIVEFEDVLYFKRKHNNNAAYTLWRKNDIKCLDQLYLVYQLNEIKKEKDLLNNRLSFYSELNELGGYLYKRINGLPNEIKKNAFVFARNICEINGSILINNKDYVINNLAKSFKTNDYKLWELISKYNRYE